AGNLPFFAYDRRMMAGQVNTLRRLLPPSIRLSYSVKANPMPAVVQLFGNIVDGLDVSSVEELRQALSAVGDPSRVQFSGPGKSWEELRGAMAAGATISIESCSQLRRAAEIGRALRQKPQVVLRVNPDFSVGRSGMRMGGGAAQFGIDAEEVPGILAQVDPDRVDLRGFHVFWGSQNLDAELIVGAYRDCIRMILDLPARAAPSTIDVHIGSGLGIPYTDRQRELDIERVARGLMAILQDLLPGERSRLQITLESGRYLVGHAGIYVCRVLERKVSRGKTFLITDGGMHHHLAASGNFGRAQLGNYPIAIGNKIDDDEREEVAVVGRLCTPLDRFAERIALPRAEAGDFVVIFQSGAYARSASPAGFISHPQPRELLI
ncbi:MAG: alanine racemase, partial [Acetobacteraceae bacterium]|nr:alanine racemase [Acetobacteraceae bacterium]